MYEYESSSNCGTIVVQGPFMHGPSAFKINLEPATATMELGCPPFLEIVRKMKGIQVFLTHR